ncbi:putative CAAX prenyl protease 2 [Fulvia fulva]|uniref:intramembrane prenyl-peptidase Rce1 n=1 Tax=Passalora fulva TaxID=5499 RepID=A0A9Q8P5S3_PASFU|nr:putative CAAX prenyl protease 2 [Fulvia fulva]KAK4632644.1 putative CAAX prenyl protease 2 [Fulvia fulva]UJO14415.1 putative CAAX prenyl protease 2 [Fulvia fulva]
MAPPMKAPTNMWSKGSALVERLKEFYTGKKETPPLISERTALLCAIGFTVLYVAPFYLSKTLRTSPLVSRDSPAVIRARVRAVGLSCLASTVIAVYVLATYGHATPRDVLRLFAMWPVDPTDCLKVLGLVCVLFVGPLYETLIADSAWRDLSFKAIKENFWDHLPGFRNYVVAPWCEELVFRSLVIGLYQLAKVSPTRIVFVTPLIFGVAHVHHLVEFCQSRTPPGRIIPPANVILMGVVQSLFQFTYTTLFGFFAAFVMLRTGNVFASVTAHTFCNCMGLPRMWGRVGQFEEWEGHNVTPDVAQGKRDDSLDQVRVGNSLMQEQSEDEKHAADAMKTRKRNLGVGWTVVYYLLFFGGAYGFYRLLWTLTESRNALVHF